jgi:hypothetical protein
MSDPNDPARDGERPGDLPSDSREPHVGKDEVKTDDLVEGLTDSSDEVSLSAAKTIADAAEQVVVRLGIEKFIDQQWPKIDEKLRECEGLAKLTQTFGGDMIFISMAIPLVNGIIHVGSDRDRLSKTSEWIAREWRKPTLTYDPERIPVISALTLIYLITKGWKATRTLKGKDERKELWKRMQKRVQRLCSDKATRPATKQQPGASPA